jgi:hypothetical protein
MDRTRLLSALLSIVYNPLSIIALISIGVLVYYFKYKTKLGLWIMILGTIITTFQIELMLFYHLNPYSFQLLLPIGKRWLLTYWPFPLCAPIYLSSTFMIYYGRWMLKPINNNVSYKPQYGDTHVNICKVSLRTQSVMIFGVLGLLYSLFYMDVSIPTNNGRVINVGLLNDLLAYIIISGLPLLIGVILYYLESSTYVNVGDTKNCPSYAEIIKLEAVKCRFCGEQFDHTEVARQIAEVKKAGERP